MTMNRLARFLKRLWNRPAPASLDYLPFSAHEFARLIYSRDPADKKALANGLARPVAKRRPKQRA
jgi:hypothetical protein